MERYCYEGPVYYYGNYIGNKTIYTMAPSIAKARNNILFRLGEFNSIEASRYDIVDKHLTVYDPITDDNCNLIINNTHRDKCEQCGYELNDMGECPVCDYGEYDLLEAIHQLQAIDE
jgi:rubrerythrin